ncbi:MAG: DPP IV N-terminal domain-containing protein, partial [Chitinophagaceae bacterium]
MNRYFYIFLFSFLTLTAIAQRVTPAVKANYQLASRFSPKKLDRLVFSTAVDPHWLSKPGRFWYQYQTSNGKKWYLVDAVKGTKQQLFDNDKLAAAITKIVKDPFDGQNLPIDSMKFIKDETALQFEVKSSIEVKTPDTTASGATKGGAITSGRAAAAKPSTTTRKVFYFEYDIASGTVTELKEVNKPKRKPVWASISPDSQTIVFSKNFNLYYMDRANYIKAQKNEDDSTIIEHALTTDGVEFFSYGGGGGENNVEKERNRKKRKFAQVAWSPDSKTFAMRKTDDRKVKDLWVINNIAEPRPTLETFKYPMPGEAEQPIAYVLLFDNVNHTYKTLGTSLFKDQDISISNAVQLKKNRDSEFRTSTWLGNADKFYVTRTS